MMLSKHIDIEDSKPLNKNIKELTLSCYFDHEETDSIRGTCPRRDNLKRLIDLEETDSIINP